MNNNVFCECGYHLFDKAEPIIIKIKSFQDVYYIYKIFENQKSEVVNGISNLLINWRTYENTNGEKDEEDNAVT